MPNFLGKDKCAHDDSFSKGLNGLLEYPHYTKPRDFRGMLVPDVLLNGNHKEIDKWRKKESIRRTLIRRPDLLKDYKFDKEELKLYNEVILEEKK